VSGFVAGRWFSPGTPVFSTNKTDCTNINEILLKIKIFFSNITVSFTIQKEIKFIINIVIITLLPFFIEMLQYDWL
jgi:hypothetical protein